MQWCVPGLILPMQLAWRVVFSLIQERSIGRQSSGFSGTSKVHRRHVCATGELIRSWKAILIQIWLEILMEGNLHQDFYTLLQGELCHGSQDYRSVLLYPHQKQFYCSSGSWKRNVVAKAISPRIRNQSERLQSTL